MDINPENLTLTSVVFEFKINYLIALHETI